MRSGCAKLCEQHYAELSKQFSERCCASPREPCCQRCGSAMLTNYVVPALFNHQGCNSLLTMWSNHINTSENYYFVKVVLSYSNILPQPFVASSMLFVDETTKLLVPRSCSSMK